MKIRTIENLDVCGKFVLLRDDFNVQIVDGKITDAFRIEQSMPTINALRQAGARIAIVAHRGRPKGEHNMEYTLQPIADYMNIPLIPDCLDKGFMNNMQNGDVVLLENVRFYAGEEKNDPAFAADLARGFDLFINDAFAVSHRAHASTVGVAEILPSYAGKLLADEIMHLTAVMENPKRPLLSIVAGSKVSPIINVSDNFANAFNTPIFVETLLPATIDNSGRAGFSITADKCSISDANKSPAYDGKISATPTVLAWARWDTANASFTNISNPRAKSAENAGSLDSSPA